MTKLVIRSPLGLQETVDRFQSTQSYRHRLKMDKGRQHQWGGKFLQLTGQVAPPGVWLRWAGAFPSWPRGLLDKDLGWNIAFVYYFYQCLCIRSCHSEVKKKNHLFLIDRSLHLCIFTRLFAHCVTIIVKSHTYQQHTILYYYTNNNTFCFVFVHTFGIVPLQAHWDIRILTNKNIVYYISVNIHLTTQ